MKEVTYKNGTKSKILIFKSHGVLLYFVRVLMVFPIVGTVTWYYGNLIVLYLLMVWVMCLIGDNLT